MSEEVVPDETEGVLQGDAPTSQAGPVPIVEVRDVARVFLSPEGERFTAIEHVHLVVEDLPGKGEMRAVLGPSGCGKSTLLNMIAGLDRPTTGSVKVKGKEVTGPGPERGMVFQNYSSMPWLNVLDNVSYGLKLRGIRKKERHDRARALIERVGLSGHETKYPNNLSGGMRQRVAIARTLAVEPDIILMDEPFGALDVQTRLDMQNLILDIWEEREATILFVTHDIGEAIYLSDRIYMFSAGPGRIIEEFDIEFPDKRTREVKSSMRFRRYETMILERLHELSGDEDMEFSMTV
ncbi:MAG: ABC transporter ATP-binding protein [Myxococcota bacterium]